MLLGGSTLPQFQLEIPQFLYVSDVICEEMTEENFTPHCVHAPEVQEKFVFEHEWALGDVVMWDNLATIHGRTYFPETETRLLRRCTIEGSPLKMAG